MAIETPTHAQGLVHTDDFHLIDTAMARHTTDAYVEMNRVIEERVVGKLVHAHPFDRLTRAEAFTHRLETRRVLLYDRMATHARLRWRNHRLRRTFDVRVAVATIDAKLTRVQSVAIRDRLNRLVPDLKIRRREVVPKDERDCAAADNRSYGEDEREDVECFREDLHDAFV